VGAHGYIFAPLSLHITGPTSADMYSLGRIFTATFVFSVGLGSALDVWPSAAYYDPSAGGGSMLDKAGNGLGEPLNVRFLCLFVAITL